LQAAHTRFPNELITQWCRSVRLRRCHGL